MLKLLSIVFVLVLLVSCNNGEQREKEAPLADLIDKGRMAEIMTDISLAEAVISLKTIQDPAFKPDSTIRFNVFKQYNITRKQYENNIQYYSKHPREFKEIYDEVAKKLEAMGKK